MISGKMYSTTSCASIEISVLSAPTEVRASRVQKAKSAILLIVSSFPGEAFFLKKFLYMPMPHAIVYAMQSTNKPHWPFASVVTMPNHRAQVLI